jgi:tetratricopeptide (TPR) repeat protein
MYLFNAKIETPEKLEQMLVGREQIVNALVEAQFQHSLGGMPPQYLAIGPRGSGKTHILRVIYDRLSKNHNYMAVHEIAYMVEDETGIGSYFDLLLRMLEAFKRWSTDEQKAKYIFEQLEQLKESYPKDWAKNAEKILLDLLKNKTLLVLIENFDSIMRGMDMKDKASELAKLRDFMQQHNQISFIATSQALIHSLSDNQNPLYGFFQVVQLKRLTLEESYEFIKKLAAAENNEDLLQFLVTPDGRGHLEAIHQFTKGNHRLLLVFLDFLKAEFRSNLSEVFLKSIDELKPYYDSFIKSLSPQQQKIAQYLALQRNPQKGVNIGRNCFLDKSIVSKQISELQRLGYVNAVNEKGRDKYYEISEPLLRMCIEINEDRNGIIKLFVNFLGKLYTAEQLKEKYLYYNYLDRFQPEHLQKLYKEEAKIYSLVKSQFLSSWSLLEEEEKRLISCCEPDDAKKLIVEISQKKETVIIDSRRILGLINQHDWNEVIEIVMDHFKTDPNNPYLFSLLGGALSAKGQTKRAIKSFEKAIEINPDIVLPWIGLGIIFKSNKQYNKSVDVYLRAKELTPENEEVWHNLGISYRELNLFENAIEAFLKASELKPEDEQNWINLGILFSKTNQYNEAMNAYLKYIEIEPNNSIVWETIGLIYYMQNKFLDSKNAFKNAIDKASDSKNQTSIHFDFFLASLFKLEETEEALLAIDSFFSIPEKFNTLIEIETALIVLFEENSESYIKEICKKLLILCIENNALEKLSAILSNVIFKLLREYKEIKPFRMEMIKHLFNEIFSSNPEFTYPIRFFDIGIRYFIKKEKEAIYEMSQEERLLFEKYTSADTKE